MEFYERTIAQCVQRGLMSTSDSILVLAGGNTDRAAFLHNNFANVLITNLEFDRGVREYHPFLWERQDAENLTYEDNSFDWVFVHAGLHHLGSPHRGLCEMLRVSRKGIGVLEARDSALNKVATWVGIVPNYELEPAILTEGKYGGYRNSGIPNYVYRWTEREVLKTVSSCVPQFVHEYHFFYGITIPTQRLSMSPSLWKRAAGGIALYAAPLFQLLLRRQGNRFAFVITKRGQLQPWLKTTNNDIEFDMGYAKDRYLPEKSRVKQ